MTQKSPFFLLKPYRHLQEACLIINTSRHLQRRRKNLLNPSLKPLKRSEKLMAKTVWCWKSCGTMKIPVLWVIGIIQWNLMRGPVIFQLSIWMINQNQEFSLKLQNSWKQGIVTIQGIVTCVFLRRFYPKVWWLQQRRFLRIYVKSMWKWNPLSPSTETRKFGATDLLFGVRTEWPFCWSFCFFHIRNPLQSVEKFRSKSFLAKKKDLFSFSWCDSSGVVTSSLKATQRFCPCFLSKFHSSLSAKMFRRIQAPSLSGTRRKVQLFLLLRNTGKARSSI